MYEAMTDEDIPEAWLVPATEIKCLHREPRPLTDSDVEAQSFRQVRSALAEGKTVVARYGGWYEVSVRYDDNLTRRTRSQPRPCKRPWLLTLRAHTKRHGYRSTEKTRYTTLARAVAGAMRQYSGLLF